MVIPPQKMWNLGYKRKVVRDLCLEVWLRCISSRLSGITPAGVSQDFECGAGEHPAAHLRHGVLWSQITKGPQMSWMGQGALGPEGERATDIWTNPPPPPKEGAYGVQIKVGLPSFRSQGLDHVRTRGPAAPEGQTNLVPPVRLFRWEVSYCDPNGRASMVNNMTHSNSERESPPLRPNGKLTLQLKRQSLDDIGAGEPTQRFECESPLPEW